MPGLACLNHLSTGVKSKSSPACARDCTTAARVLRREAACVQEGKGTAQGAVGGHQNVRSWQLAVTNGASPAAWLQTRPCPALALGAARVRRGIPRMSALPPSPKADLELTFSLNQKAPVVKVRR